MNKLHIIPTRKPSRLFIHNAFNYLRLDDKSVPFDNNRHVYITSDEEFDKYAFVINSVGKIESVPNSKWGKKIILTTDQDLIADGVQAIDDKFLEWLVKNPSCEEVGVAHETQAFDVHGKKLDYAMENGDYTKTVYKTLIPKEEECTCKTGEPYNNTCCKIHGLEYPNPVTPQEARLAKLYPLPSDGVLRGTRDSLATGTSNTLPASGSVGKQTAVEWLVEQTNADCLNSTFIRQGLIDKAKQMEQQQIEDAKSEIGLSLSDVEKAIMDCIFKWDEGKLGAKAVAKSYIESLPKQKYKL